MWQSQPASASAELAIIIPTRNEAGNIAPLLQQLDQALGSLSAEIIFVDDSDDTTPDNIRQQAPQIGRNITLIHRLPAQRTDGLGGAVVLGFQATQASWLCVMDADLQHPPAMVPALLQAAQSQNLDLVLGSRLKTGGDTHGLGRKRHLISYLLAWTTKLTFPMRLWRVSDPLTGLFLLRNGAINWQELQPDGFKILLEIVVRAPKLRLGELAFSFGERHAEQSKASFREVVRLLRHYVRLRLTADAYLIRFLLVGFVGAGVNTLLLQTLAPLWGVLWASLFASQLTMVSNFLFFERWVFHDRRAWFSVGVRVAGFWAFNTLFWSISYPLLRFSADRTTLALANFLTIGLFTLPRFLSADHLFWKRLPQQPLSRTPLLRSHR